MDDPLAFLLDAMSDAVVVRGPDGALLFANPQAQQLRLPERSFATFEELNTTARSISVAVSGCPKLNSP